MIQMLIIYTYTYICMHTYIWMDIDTDINMAVDTDFCRTLSRMNTTIQSC